MWWAFVSVAFASEIEVRSATPVRVSVDGTMLENDDGDSIVTVKDLVPGSYTVEVHSALDKPIAKMTVDVPDDRQVRVDYSAYKLEATVGPIPFDSVDLALLTSPAYGTQAKVPVDASVLAWFRRDLLSAESDTRRLLKLSNFVGEHRFTTAQVASLVVCVQSETKRLQAVELFVGRVVDPENLEALEPAFRDHASRLWATSYFAD